MTEGNELAAIFKIAQQNKVPLRYEISKAILKRAMKLKCKIRFNSSEFFITEQIGRVAFRGIDIENRDIVIKVSYPKEYERLKVFDHENIEQVFDYDPMTRIMLLKFIKGGDYWGFLASGPTIDDICDVTMQLCKALEYINSKGFLYRDIAPNNLLVVKLPTGKWKVMLVDFEVTESLTDKNSFLNILEVGTLLYYTFTGMRYPRLLEYHTDIIPHSLGPYHSIPQIPYELDNIIRKMLFKDPKGKIYHSLKEVLEDLENIFVSLRRAEPVSDFDTKSSRSCL